jgi:RNA polymerase sigma-70 factor (ECF subfamily)
LRRDAIHEMNRAATKDLPIPDPVGSADGYTGGRLVAKSSVETSAQIERLVARAVARAKQGDREAVRFLYLRYADNVYGYVRTIVRDHHDAEDVTQQVFTKLMTAICKFEQREVPFVAWLLRMSHNVAVDAVRARRATPAAEIFGPDETISEETPQRARSLHAAFASLPVEQRQVVVLRHVLGLTPVEIAEQLNRTNSSVYGLHHRGRRAMCAELERLDSAPLTAPRHLRAAA